MKKFKLFILAIVARKRAHAQTVQFATKNPQLGKALPFSATIKAQCCC